jgi:hypothetical protein
MLCAIVLWALGAGPAGAGIVDTPLPVLLPGKPTLHLYSVPGVVNSGGIGTFFACTSTASATMQVGVEVFPPPGGGPINDAMATSLSVEPGASVRFGTSSAVGIVIGSNLGTGPISNGSARILATSKSLICTAFVADTTTAPVASGWQLTIVAKTKQKAAN